MGVARGKWGKRWVGRGGGAAGVLLARGREERGVEGWVGRGGKGGQREGEMERWREGWPNLWVDGQREGCPDGQTDRWMDGGGLKPCRAWGRVAQPGPWPGLRPR